MKESYSPSEASVRCSKCGRLVKKGYAFCPRCGTKVEGIEYRR